LQAGSEFVAVHIGTRGFLQILKRKNKTSWITTIDIYSFRLLEINRLPLFRDGREPTVFHSIY